MFAKVSKKIRRLRHRLMPKKVVFSKIYHDNHWRGQNTVSGTGSDLIQTSAIRQEIPILLKRINAKSLLDAACGDFNWMKEAKLDLEKYIGVDIVPELIAQDQEKYGDGTREFMNLDITKDDLPQVDLILCRDCLVHLPFKHIFAAIHNFKKSRSEYLLTTTFTELEKNKDIVTGRWRPLNFQLPPFGFPKPIRLIDEKCTEKDGKYSDKRLALWKLEDILP